MSAPKVIELKFDHLDQLISSSQPDILGGGIDPSVREYLYDEAEAQPLNSSLQLRITLPKADPSQHNRRAITQATNAYFSYQAQKAWRHMHDIFRQGRLSLVIALLYIAITFFAAYWVGRASNDLKAIVTSLFVIGAWVALWRPIEAFLFDWWPIRRQARIFEMLAEMEVEVISEPGKSS